MHCPKCGQQQISDQTRFCSRCGFLLTGIAEVVANDGLLPMPSQAKLAKDSPRRKGVMQGAFVFLLSFLLVPLTAILCMAMGIGPEPVAIVAILLTVGGLLRIAYALMFESGGAAAGHSPGQSFPAAAQNVFAGKKEAGELPPAQSIPASVYAPPPGTGRWRETNELETPGSVTDSTTRLLHDERDQ